MLRLKLLHVSKGQMVVHNVSLMRDEANVCVPFTIRLHSMHNLKFPKKFLHTIYVFNDNPFEQFDSCSYTKIMRCCTSHIFKPLSFHIFAACCRFARIRIISSWQKREQDTTCFNCTIHLTRLRYILRPREVSKPPRYGLTVLRFAGVMSKCPIH